MAKQKRITRLFFEIFHATKINILYFLLSEKLLHFLGKQKLSTLSSARSSFYQFKVLVQTVFAIAVQNDEGRGDQEFEISNWEAVVLFLLKVVLYYFDVLRVAA